MKKLIVTRTHDQNGVKLQDKIYFRHFSAGTQNAVFTREIKEAFQFDHYVHAYKIVKDLLLSPRGVYCISTHFINLD